MHRYLCILLFAFSLLTAEESPDYTTLLTNLESEPSSIAFGCVNVISGSYIEHCKDLDVVGPDPLTVERTYTSGSKAKGFLYTGWEINHQSYVTEDEFKDNKGKYQARLRYTGAYGEPTVFDKTSKKKNSSFNYLNTTIPKGVTNCSSGFMSAGTKFQNMKVCKTDDDKSYRIDFADGRIGLFKYLGFDLNKNGGKGDNIHLLDKLILPDQNYYTYTIDKKCKDRSYNLHNKKGNLLSSLQFTVNDNTSCYRFDASNGDHVTYAFEVKSGKMKYGKLKKAQCHLGYVESNTSAPIRYHWKHEQIVRKELPDSRFLKIKYQDDGKVNNLSSPLGEDKTPCTIGVLSYKTHWNKKGEVVAGYTDVFNTYNIKTRYCYNDDHRLTEVIKHTNDVHPYTSEHMYWGPNNSHLETCLLARTFAPFGQSPLYMHYYLYDTVGNVKLHQLLGNLTGRNTQPIIVSNQLYTPVSNGVESYNVEFEHNERNLVTKEKHPSYTTEYRYYPNTNLPEAKFTWSGSSIRERFFYAYDENGCLIEEIHDDGTMPHKNDLSCVTERKIRRMHNRDINPVGLPQWTIYSYLDLSTGQEVVQNKLVYHYDQKGHLIALEHYPTDLPSYLETWSYNQHGKVTKKVDAFGHTTTYEYDENDNLVKEVPLYKPGCSKNYFYDYSNRLIKTEDCHEHDQKLVTHYKYNHLGHKIAKIDEFGHTTDYENDPFGRLIKTTLPAIADENGHLYRPCTYVEYDHMSNPVTVTDNKGFKIHSKYTIRGKPYYTRNPDGTEEHVTYNLDGTVRETISKTGEKILFTRDYQGRVTLEEHYDLHSNYLYSKSATYNHFHILSETDPSGLTTFYTYDFAGNLKSTQTGTCITQMEYDTQSRLIKTITGDSVLTKDYDILSRVIEERIEDLQGTIYKKTLTQYDFEGRVIATITDIDGKQALQTTEFNSFGLPAVVTDPLGFKTYTHVNYSHYNEYGQRVTQSSCVSSNGTAIYTTFNTLGHVVRIETKDPFDQLIQQEESVFDDKGQVIRTVNTSLPSGKKVINTTEYDSTGKILALTEAFGTPEQRRTLHHYNAFGQKIQTIKTDGTALNYFYDAKGRLSCDNLYTYSYDITDKITSVTNQITQRTTEHIYDTQHRSIAEKQENEIRISYDYDLQDRINCMHLPDGSSVSYTYSPISLHTIQRNDLTHTYQKHDVGGNLLKSTLMGQLGDINYSYDAKGQLTSIKSAYYNEQVAYDSIGNIVTLDDETYTYNYLNQIVSEPDHTYAYDSLQNRTAKNDQTFTYNSLNEILSDDIDYDANGNCIRNGKQLFSYDCLDRLIHYKNQEVEATYEYDYLNRRQFKILKSGKTITVTRYIYNGSNEIGAIDENDKIQELRILGQGLGAEIGAAVLLELQGKPYIPFHDHNGNICELYTPNGTRVAKTSFTSFGEIRSHIGTTLPWGYASKRKDAESGLINFGRRYYNTQQGRWLTPDPLGYSAGVNLYAYVSNNPLSHIDAYGLFEQNSNLSEIDFATPVQNTSIFCSVVENFQYAASLGSELVKEAVPFKGLKDILGFPFHLASGQPISQFKCSYTNDKSCVYNYEGQNSIQNIDFMFVNGIENPFDQALSSCKSVGLAFGDVRVRGIYNHTGGMFYDLIRQFAMMRFGYKCDATKLLRNQILYQLYENPDMNLVLISHSQGVEVTWQAIRNLHPSLKKRLIIGTFGGARPIPNTGFRYVMNYICKNDPIPHILYVNYRLAMLNKRRFNITLLDSEGNDPMFNHTFENPVYQKALSKFASKIKPLIKEIQ